MLPSSEIALMAKVRSQDLERQILALLRRAMDTECFEDADHLLRAFEVAAPATSFDTTLLEAYLSVVARPAGT